MTGQESRDDKREALAAPTRLFVDDLGYVWQDGATEPNPDGTPSALSMARTTTRNLPSTGLIEYRPVKHEPSCLSLTNSDQSDVCDCRTIRLLQFLDLMRAQETDRRHPEPDITERDIVAVAIAKAADGDYWADEIREWEKSEEWEREAHPDNYPSDAYEDRDWYRKQADAAITALRVSVGEREQSDG